LGAQAPEVIEHKNYSKTFQALSFYDVDDLYVCSESLTKRNLGIDELCIAVKLLTHSEVSHLLEQHKHILSF
jgi:tRNA 2-thiouridine synthesizing protein C